MITNETHRELVFRDLTPDDLAAVVAVHKASFPKAALSRLGSTPIRHYYQWQLDGPHDAIATGAFIDDELVGFSFAGTFRGALSGFLRENRWLLFRCLLMRPWLLFNSRVRRRLKFGARILKRFRKSKRKSAKPETRREKTFGILAIAVHPSCQRLGVGRQLMLLAEEMAAERGFAEIGLSVDPANEPAVAFYQRLNWEKVGESTGWDGRMRKPVESSFGGSA